MSSNQCNDFVMKKEQAMIITHDERQATQERMGQAMGAYIEATGKLDFSSWTPDEWEAFVSVAYDICAPEVFMHRVVISGPMVECNTDALSGDVSF